MKLLPILLYALFALAPSAGAAARHNMAALETAMGAGFNRDALDVIVAAFEKLGG